VLENKSELLYIGPLMY